MDHLRASGFVRADSLEWSAQPGLLLLTGEIACLGDIVIAVEKTLTVVDDEASVGDLLVQTFRYAYNASIRGHDNFLRHDNAHPYPGHPDSHHRHEFDWKTGDHKPGFPKWVGATGWPTLGAFVDEVSSWYWINRHLLPNPEGVPGLGLRDRSTLP